MTRTTSEDDLHFRPVSATGQGRPVYDAGSDPRPIFSGLQRFYDRAVPLAWPLVRLAVGWNFLVHGWGKVMAGTEKVTPAFVAIGFTNPYPIAITSTWLEFLGGLGLILGIATRFWAAALAVELAYITFGLYWGNGFSWLNRGYEYTLLWGALCFAIALRGGGPYSIDRRLGREL